MAWTFRFLEEIALADIAFEAEGESIEEVFRGGTQALLQSMANPSTVAETWERTIERSDVDPSALLFEWLSEVVYWKDAAGVVYREAPLALTHEHDVWLLRILPLAIKMWRKGKIPNPFGHAFPGLSQVRALIQRVRRATPPV